MRVNGSGASHATKVKLSHAQDSCYLTLTPTPVAVRPKAEVCGRSTAEVAGSNRWPSGLRRGSAGDLLRKLRFRIPPQAWTFVLCVLYSKDKRQNRGQSGQRSTDKVQTEQKQNKKIPPWAWMFVLCVVSKDKKAKCRTIKTKKQLRKKYKQSTRE